MKTNLIFKRQITEGNVVKTVTKIVPVFVPFINSGEGWILSGHTDTVEICESVDTKIIENPLLSENDDKSTKEDVVKFTSSVTGTAKLVRSKGGIIKITARRGTTTYNQTTPNSVCIDDTVKNDFFKHCRNVHKNTNLFEFNISDGSPYDYWNDFIDKEYNRQKQAYLKTL